MEKGVSSIPEVSKRAEGPNEKCSSCSTAEGANVVLDEGVCDGVDAGDHVWLRGLFDRDQQRVGVADAVEAQAVDALRRGQRYVEAGA